VTGLLLVRLLPKHCTIPARYSSATSPPTDRAPIAIALVQVMNRIASTEVDSSRAWLTVAAAFLAGFVVFGITYSFGVFVDPMGTEFHASRVAASTFFSITGLIFYALGSLTGHLSDRLGPRIVVSAGALLMGAGLVSTAFIPQMWVGYLTYGIGVGLGAACAYVPTLAVVGGWFARRRNTALGIAAAGTGCGMLIMPPLAATLIEHYGWRDADVILGIGCAALLMICAVLTERPPLAPAPAWQSLYRVVRSRAFVLLYISWVLATAALFVPFVFLPAFALDQGASQVLASALISVLGGMSVMGRLGLGVLGNYIGALSLFKIATFVMGVSYMAWLTATTAYGWLLVFAAVLGLAYGVRIALMPVVLIEIFGLQNIGAVLGVFFTATGFSAVIGPPLAGLIVDCTGSYRWAAAFAFAMGLLGFAAVLRLKADRVSTIESV
jgi:MFS family permease